MHNDLIRLLMKEYLDPRGYNSLTRSSPKYAYFGRSQEVIDALKEPPNGNFLVKEIDGWRHRYNLPNDQYAKYVTYSYDADKRAYINPIEAIVSTGWCYSYHYSGNVSEKFYQKNYIKHGPWESYDKDGNVTGKGNYIDGRFTGYKGRKSDSSSLERHIEYISDGVLIVNIYKTKMSRETLNTILSFLTVTE